MPGKYLDRLNKELSDLKKNPVCNCDARPDDETLMEWTSTIIGPIGTPYENGIFKLKMTFSSSYPFKSPQVRFITKIFHPNIDSAGGICLDILKEKWSPILGIEKILLSICSSLDETIPQDPLVTYAADLYMNDREAFNNEAKSWTAIYANPDTAK